MLRRILLFLALVAIAVTACTDVPIDDERNDKRLFPPRGVIRGTVTYVGPPPCSRAGHIVGNAVVLVFDRRNPPPPNGLATSAVNFVAVPGDVLFSNQPRTVADELFCPPTTSNIEASAPFAVAPVEPGSYVVAAFYDRRGRFWPTFKFRNLPEAGDLAGGYIDVEDARRNAGNLAYQPIYRPVDVGIRQPAPADEIPDFTIGPNGYVADNIPVSIGRVVPFTRPYFHPRHIDPVTKTETSAEEIGEPLRSPANTVADPLAVPILAMTQDVHVLAPPSSPTPQTLAAYQEGFQSLKLAWGVAKNEFDDATDPRQPFGFQLPALPPNGKGGLLVFARGGSIPENPSVPELWPQVALVKLASDPERKTDLQSLVVQGTREETLVTGKPPGPIVVIQGITLFDDSLARTIAGPVPAAPTTSALRDHLTALIRPAALCFDPRRVDLGGVLVTPHLTGRSADGSESGQRPLFDAKAIAAQPRVREVRRGCLPTGRYAISLVYPTGQAWTVPNESGGCSAQEGSVRVGDRVGSCTGKPRTVLLSQGSRGVVEIIGPSQEGIDSGICDDFPVPAECQAP
ncbi:MAG: hypothetical protein KF764_14520 [Labilithrix sp.]|nr:hypothetical protein [Labilithrix sp.]MBX3225324.1 hypothetical protein [Labilithrix sp.]